MKIRQMLALLRLICYIILFGACWVVGELWLRDWLQYGSFWHSSPTITSNATIRSNAPPFLGITVELQQATPAQRQDDLQRLKHDGFGWVRQRFDWSRIEPTMGDFHWQESDAMIAAVMQAKLEPVVLLDGSPRWARSSQDRANSLAPPQAFADFANFAQEFAKRYGASVRYYQIWDEPNIAPHWGARHIEPVAYAHMLAQAGAAIRLVDPNAVILTAALAPTADRGHTAIDESTYLQRLYAVGSHPAFAYVDGSDGSSTALFDVVAIQPFGFGTAPQEGNAARHALNFQRAAWVRRTMLLAGDASRPIWAVRYGWNRTSSTTWQAVSPEHQAQFAADALGIAQNHWPWMQAMGWAIDQPAADDRLYGFALEEHLASAIHNTSRNIRHSASHSASQAKGQIDRVDRTMQSEHRITMLAWALCLVSVLMGWRSWRAVSCLPWTQWRHHFRSLPSIFHILVWGSLIGLYYVVTATPLIVLCWLGFVLLCWMQPMVGLCLTVGLLPLHFQHKEVVFVNGVLTMPPARVVILALLPVLLARLRNNWQRSTFQQAISQLAWLDWLALLWLLINGLSAVNVWHWQGYAAGMVDQVFAPLALYGAIRILTINHQIDQVVASLWAGGVLVALWGLSTWLQGDGTLADGWLRLVGPTFSPNHTALYLERSLFIGIGLLLVANQHRITSTVLLSGSALILVALLLTASRGALLLAAPTGTVAMLTIVSSGFGLHLGQTQGQRVWRGTQWRKRLILALCLLCGVILLIGMMQFERLTNSATLIRRITIWQASWQMVQDFTFFGVGPLGYYWRYPGYILEKPMLDPNLRHPHNIWLEFLCRSGLLGLLWLLFAIWSIGQSVMNTLRPKMIALVGHAEYPPLGRVDCLVVAGLCSGLLAGLIHAQVDTFMALPDIAAWNWSAIGVIATLHKKKNLFGGSKPNRS